MHEQARYDQNFMDRVLDILKRKPCGCRYGTCNKCLVRKGLMKRGDARSELAFCGQCQKPLLHCSCKGRGEINDD